MARIIGWVLGVVGGIMAALNYEFIRFSSFINSYNGFERLLLEDYIDRGNTAIIGAIMFFAAVCIICYINSKEFLDRTVEKTNNEEAPE